MMKIVRILSICMLLCCMLSNIWGQPQQLPPLERPVSLNVTNMPIAEFLDQLSKEGKFSFSYNPKIINNRKVTLSCTQKPVKQVLNQLFAGTVTYKAKGNYIILTSAQSAKPVEQKTPKYFKITGYVIDGNTTAKVDAASIYDDKTLHSAVSDQYGYFSIQIPYNSPDVILNIKKAGYKDSSIVITQKGFQTLEIALNPEKAMELTIDVPDDTTTALDTTSQVTSVRFQDDSAKKPTLAGTFDNLKFIINTKFKTHLVNISDTLFRKVQFGILPAISTNRLISGNVVNNYSYNLLIGFNGGVKKVEMAGLMNIDRGDVQKCQLAGLGNFVGGRVSGYQASSLINYVTDTLAGVQMVGLVNYNKSHTKGFQSAGLANHTKTLDGVQFAGLYNSTNQGKGGQFAGLFNSSLDMKGTQVAGLFNVAQDVEGVQVAALFNVAKKVKGSQISLINISDTCTGVSVGLINFVKSGYHKIEVSTDDVLRCNVAFRTGVRQFHNIFAVGSNLVSNNRFAWSYTYGLGTSFKLGPKLLLDLDLTCTHLHSGKPAEYLSLNNKINLGLDWQVAKKFSIAFGPSFNNYVVDSRLYQENNFYQSLGNAYPSSLIDTSSDIDIKNWIGWKVAVRFL